MVLQNDKYGMEWNEGVTPWGTVKLPEHLKCEVSRREEGGLVHERYTFTNTGDKELFTSLKDIGIYTPFNDDYTDAATCMVNRCHTHLWCGGEVAYICALRMGGEPPHLGLVLTEGSICGYSVERDFGKISNDRGDFILHPSPTSLAPRESFSIGWTLFPHLGMDDFYSRLGEYCPRYMEIRAQQYVVFLDERIHIEIRPAFAFSEAGVSIVRGGRKVDHKIESGRIVIDEAPDHAGEYSYGIEIEGVRTFCNILVQPEFGELLHARCRFIAERQQYHAPGSGLDGAYLIYDNEEQHLYYSARNDYNGGRERVCMGVLLARYLQENRDSGMEESLKKYIAYVERELFDKDTGVVFNDHGRDDSHKRPYNYPWMSLFYLELYSLYGSTEYLVNAYRIMKAFYENENGAHFYAIEIPLVRIVHELSAAGMAGEREELMEYFAEHCDFIIRRGTDYPAHEVNFEQSIVAPAANLLLQMYQATGDARYLEGAEEQLAVLELFNGRQPDYHMYQVAIRHWDGYWFGKRRLYGDTYPHYWSALTGEAFRTYAEITGSEAYGERADSAFRGVLSLFFPDGGASCAYVYPASVNGIAAGYYDAYANDQDWGLYFMLRDKGKSL